MTLLLAGKIICLLLGLHYGAPWIVKAFRGHAIAEAQTFAASCGIVGFIAMQWLL